MRAKKVPAGFTVSGAPTVGQCCWQSAVWNVARPIARAGVASTHVHVEDIAMRWTVSVTELFTGADFTAHTAINFAAPQTRSRTRSNPASHP